MDNLVKRGVNVKAFACDISQKEVFAAALDEIKADYPPIAGVLTCAMQLQVCTVIVIGAEGNNAAKF